MPMREPTVVFHVGAVPSASRVVQQSLTRHGDTWRRSRAHVLATATLARDLGWRDEVPSPAAFARTLQAVLAGEDVDVVIGARDLLGPAFTGPPGSSLHANADAAIEALAEATRSYRRVIVLSMCPQEQLLEAHYERALATQLAASSQDWVARLDLESLSWLPLHAKLTAAFGDTAVTVHNFAGTEQGHVDLLRAVLAAADLELPDTVAVRTPPPRLRLSDTGVSLAVTAQPYLAGNKERADLATFLRWNFSELDGPRAPVLSLEQSTALQRRYGDELARLAGTDEAADARLARDVRAGPR